MNQRELRMYLALQGIAANATRCPACAMVARIAAEALQEVRVCLSRDEAIELGLESAHPSEPIHRFAHQSAHNED